MCFLFVNVCLCIVRSMQAVIRLIVITPHHMVSKQSTATRVEAFSCHYQLLALCNVTLLLKVFRLDGWSFVDVVFKRMLLKHVGLLSSLLSIVNAHMLDVTSWLLVLIANKLFINIFKYSHCINFPLTSFLDGFVLLVNYFFANKHLSISEFQLYSFIPLHRWSRLSQAESVGSAQQLSCHFLSTFFSPFAAAGVCLAIALLSVCSFFERWVSCVEN